MDNRKRKITEDCIYKIEVLSLFFLATWFFFFFEERFINLFDIYILPLLDIEYSLTTNVLFVILSILLFAPRLYLNYIHRKELSFLHISSLSFILVSYLFLRFTNRETYNILPDDWIIGYLDTIPIIIFLSLLLQFINYIYNYKKGKINKQSNDFFIADEPLTDSENDLFGFTDHVNIIADKIEKISPKTHFSLGVLSEWGAGKSTYLNLLKNKLLDKKFIIVSFNPRHSFETKKIQEDFFNTLNNQLKNYNSIFSSLIVDYMKAVGIIGKNNTISIILNIYKVWNKETEKQKLNKAIDALPNRVVVFIEDLDRLLAEEIIEVFKLIDGNASLNNMIFISAYDKQHINNIIEDKYQHESSKFSDKFFSWEIDLPKEKYEKTLDYLLENLFSRININSTSVEAFKTYFKSRQSTIEKHIHTIRDAKRFINSFVESYSHISEFVLLDDYFWLQLIKYRSPKTYWNLYRREYIELNLNNFSKFKLKDNIPPDTEAYDILSLIFKSSNRKEYNSINNTAAFDDYFRIYSQKIALKELRALIYEEHNTVTFQNLNTWFKENKIDIVLEYLGTIRVSEFDNIANILRYLDVLIYISINFKFNVYNLISILFISYTAKDIITTTKVDRNKYKEELENRLKGTIGKYPYTLLSQLLINSFDDPESCEFTSEELQRIAKHNVEDYLKNKSEINDSLEIELLYCCISKIESGTRVIILDIEMCSKIKDYIINNPDFYIENFIRNGMISSDKYRFLLACEPFWKQIFIETSVMETFLSAESLNSLKKIKLVRNFWKLYEKNDYKPLEFANHNLTYDESVARNLEDECQQLEKLIRLETRFNKIKSSSKNQITRILELRDILKQIDDIHLYITKRKEIIDEISNYIREVE